MTTLAQFRTQTAAKMGLDNTADGDQTLLNGWVNSGYAEVLAESRVYVASATMALTAGSGDYTLPTQILAINELYLTSASDSQLTRVTRLSPQEILDLRVGSQSAGTPPARFYALNGSSLLMVYPTPDAADVLTVYYAPRPATLSADGDEPSSVPTEWHKTIEYYVLWQAGQYVNDRFSRNGDDYRVLYEQALSKMKKAALHRGGRRLSRAVVGGRVSAVAAPGQDDGR